MIPISEQYREALERLYANDYNKIEDKVNDWMLVNRALDRLEELEGE